MNDQVDQVAVQPAAEQAPVKQDKGKVAYVQNEADIGGVDEAAE